MTRLSEEERRELGVYTLEGFELSFHYGPTLLEASLSTSLMERWVECADRNGERVELRSALLELLGQEAIFGLAQADPIVYPLVADFLGHFTDEEADMRAVFDVLLPMVAAVLTEEEKASWKAASPLLSVLARAGRFAWARMPLLALLEYPLFQETRESFTFLLYLTAGQHYADWRPDITRLLMAESDMLRWGAVEALRSFAAPRPRGGEPRLAPETVMEDLPREVFYAESNQLLWAALELAARYGGEPGRQLLLELLADPAAARASVLGFLALRPGMLDPAICIALLKDPDRDLARAAIGALGQLVARGEAAYSDLRALAIDDEDPEVRRAAIASLGNLAGPEAAADLELATRDLDEGVQLEAVRQLGLAGEVQVELLGGIATDATRVERVRGRAFEEWLLHGEDQALPEILDAMYQDASPDLRNQGYLWKAALAEATGDETALAAWNELPVPRELLDTWIEGGMQRAAAEALPGLVRKEILSRIHDEAGKLTGAANRARLARWEAGIALGGASVARIMMRGDQIERRILAFLDQQSPQDP